MSRLQISSSSNPQLNRLTNIVRHLSPASTIHKLVVCRDLGEDVMQLLKDRKGLDLVVWPEDRKVERSWLLENVPGASGVIVMLSEQVNQELLDKAGPALKVISTMSVGYEHVDLPLLAKRGVKLGYTPDVLTDAVADVAIMLALMAGRNAKETCAVVNEGKWPNFTWSPFAFCGPQLSTSTLPTPTKAKTKNVKQVRTAGFLGFGRISQATLKRLLPFGINRCLYTSSPKSKANATADAALAREFGLEPGYLQRVDADTLARESDILFVLAPGGPSTYHIVDETFLKKMKRSAILVNPSRGTLVDSDALARALDEGWLWAAGLDVVEGEPQIDDSHPLVKHPRCVILPHIGSATLETRLGMATLTVQNAIAGIFDEPMPAQLDLTGRN